MTSNVRYLSSRSLAVYESVVIERFAETHKRNQRIQAFTMAAWLSAFLFLAAMTLVLPASLQGFIQLLTRPF